MPRKRITQKKSKINKQEKGKRTADGRKATESKQSQESKLIEASKRTAEVKHKALEKQKTMNTEKEARNRTLGSLQKRKNLIRNLKEQEKALKQGQDEVRAEGNEYAAADEERSDNSSRQHEQLQDSNSLGSANKKTTESRSDSKEKRNQSIEKTYQLLQQACARSTNFQGMLRQQQASVAVELPNALPGAVLVRALQKQEKHFHELSSSRIAAVEQLPSQLSLHVEGLTAHQLQRFIDELDELVGEFTGRN